MGAVNAAIGPFFQIVRFHETSFHVRYRLRLAPQKVRFHETLFHVRYRLRLAPHKVRLKVTIGWVKAILQRGVIQVLMIASPLLISALVIGLIVAILQATTSIQEQTLVFVPKVVVILVVLAVLGGWMFTSLGDYTRQLFNMIPSMAR